MLHGVTRMSSVVEPTKLFPSSATLARAPSWALEFAQAKSSDSEGSVPRRRTPTRRAGAIYLSQIWSARETISSRVASPVRASNVAGTRE